MKRLYPYVNELDASKGLLLDVCGHLADLRTQYLIVGGWTPYLRCNHPVLTHPGTKDVDVLLSDPPELLEKVVIRLEEAGYVHSAKHDFQMLRVLQVGQRELVFNVDLLHPAIADRKPELFQDIMDLNISESYDPNSRVVKRSILFPSSAIMFQEKLYGDVPLTATLPSSGVSTRQIPLLDEVGCIISKCDSVRSKKRWRDAYDIYLILASRGSEHFASKLRDYYSRFPDVKTQLNLLREHLQEHSDAFNHNVEHYVKAGVQLPDIPHERVLNMLFS